MRVIKSIETTDAILTYSNISEDEYPVWVSGTSYVAGQSVIYQHKIYEAIINNSSTTTPNLDQTNWLDLGATNRYRMFDNIISSVSGQTGGIEFTLTPNQSIDSLILLNVNAATVRLVMNDPIDGVVYDETKTLRSSSEVIDYFTYFFAAIDITGDVDTVVFTDLPIKPTASITVYVDSGLSYVEVGEVVYGTKTVVGRTNYSTAIGIKSYSRKDVDEFGKVTVIKRKNSKYAEYDIDIDNSNLANVQKFFADIDSVPCVFVGKEDMEELIVYGFYSDFKATISFPTVSKCTLRVEGLI